MKRNILFFCKTYSGVLFLLSFITTHSAAQCHLNNYEIKGGGSTCNNTTTVPITMAKGSEINIEYQLYKDGSIYGSAKSGTGYDLTWYVSESGYYTIVAASDDCQRNMNLTGIEGVEVSTEVIPTPQIEVLGSNCSLQLHAVGNYNFEWYRRYHLLSRERTIIANTAGDYILNATNNCENGTAEISYNVPSSMGSIQMAPSAGAVDLCPDEEKLTAFGGTDYKWVLPDGSTSFETVIFINEEGEYMLTGNTEECAAPDTARIDISFKSSVAPVPQINDVVVGTNEDATISINHYPNEYFYWYDQYRNQIHYGSDFTVNNVQEDQKFYVSKKVDGMECNSKWKPLNVYVDQPPKIKPIHDLTVIYPISKIKIQAEVSDPHNQILDYEWSQIDGNPVILTGQNTEGLIIENLTLGTYTFRLIVSDGRFQVYDDVDIVVELPSDNYNFVRTHTIRDKDIKTSSQITSLDAYGQDILTIYYDGLGRQMQINQWQRSPTFENLITPIIYDKYGRSNLNYLPFIPSAIFPSSQFYLSNQLVINADTHSYTENVKTYRTSPNVAKDSRAFSQTTFENAPSNRIISTIGPGENWKTNNRIITYSYEVNQHDQNIISWMVNNDNTSVNLIIRHDPKEGYIDGSGHYLDGQLYKSVKIDENGSSTCQYTDKDGLVILKMSQIDDTQWAKTYYIYDDFKNLRYVFPPELSDKVESEDLFNISKEDLKDLAFQYTYDYKNRLIEKVIPGGGKEISIYDRRNRLVLTQSSKQNSNNVFEFIKYDSKNRPIITGETVITSDISELRNTLDSENWESMYDPYETLDGNLFGYTSNSFPININQDNIYSVTYYDNYDFKQQNNFNSSLFDYDRPDIDCSNKCYEDEEYKYVDGLVTGTINRILGKDKWIQQVFYYDQFQQQIQSVSLNEYFNSNIRRSIIYDFVGNVLEAFVERKSNYQNIGVRSKFEYDHAGRIMDAYHELYENNMSQGEVHLAHNDYNEIGELIQKNLHVVNGQSKQSIDYRYNIRGWLQSINGSTLEITPDNPEDDVKDYFGMDLYYDHFITPNSN